MIRFVLSLTVFAVLAQSAFAQCGAGRLGLFHRFASLRASMAQARADHAIFPFMARLHQARADRHGARMDRIEMRRGGMYAPAEMQLVPAMPGEQLPGKPMRAPGWGAVELPAPVLVTVPVEQPTPDDKARAAIAQALAKPKLATPNYDAEAQAALTLALQSPPGKASPAEWQNATEAVLANMRRNAAGDEAARRRLAENKYPYPWSDYWNGR